MILIEEGFKPYYNWNTFNTLMSDLFGSGLIKVLNLIITGIPSIQNDAIFVINKKCTQVLNLIITGIPSIRIRTICCNCTILGFKPYYNWNTFNTSI